jgi:hypothetical protein
MKKNIGNIDRAIRILLAIMVIVLYSTGSISGVTAIVLGIVAFIFIITSLIGFCPLYAVFKISTLPKS